ncbi:MAG: hypothetical protein HY596_01115 [Candidatus Omnitrophica bacterium]|nr:hypothetical protein [Candidatus Omnitrophota bacterium]
MQRQGWWLVGAVVGGGLLMVGLRAQERQAGRPPASKAADGSAQAVVFTFADEAGVQAFANVWRQREQVLARLATLQEYWAREQQELAGLTQRLAAEYHVDVAKSYALDPQRKVLIEQSPSSPPAPVLPQPTEPPPVMNGRTEELKN